MNRITITTLAIIIKTRGIVEAEHMLYFPTMLEQILTTSQHTWSEKTLRYFPSILRDALNGRADKRGLSIELWQQVHNMLHFDIIFLESASLCWLVCCCFDFLRSFSQIQFHLSVLTLLYICHPIFFFHAVEILKDLNSQISAKVICRI